MIYISDDINIYIYIYTEYMERESESERKEEICWFVCMGVGSQQGSLRCLQEPSKTDVCHAQISL